MTNALFLADWCDALFVHFDVQPRLLAPIVPFDLDLRDGHSYVSLVGFTQKHLRFARGGRIGQILAAPLAHHEFLNLRTYVRMNEQPAIFFLAEWIPNRLATLIGPRMYGLPYRLARLRYDRSTRIVCARRDQLTMHLNTREARVEPCRRDSLDEFLLERYIAFTRHRNTCRRFDVAHAPWQQSRAKVDVVDLRLIQNVLPWLRREQMIDAQYSPGVCNVRISAPRRVRAGEDDSIIS
jgi:uncharacterized protein YqjF (DUF2071 family)